MFISPSQISKDSGIDLETVYKVLDVIPIFKKQLVTVCSSCSVPHDSYDVIADIPQSFICKKCGKENNVPLDTTYVLYKEENHGKK